MRGVQAGRGSRAGGEYGGGWPRRFTVEHNIRAVCVGARVVVVRAARVSPSPAPAAPPRRPNGASDWSTLFKMASSPHKIRFISIPGKEALAGSPDDS